MFLIYAALAVILVGAAVYGILNLRRPEESAERLSPAGLDGEEGAAWLAGQPEVKNRIFYRRDPLHLAGFSRVMPEIYREAAGRLASDNAGALSWYVDHYPFLRQTLLRLEKALTTKSVGELPVFSAGPLKNVPRCYAIVRTALELHQMKLSVEDLTEAAQAYERNKPLAIRELWVLPEMAQALLLQAVVKLAQESLEEEKNGQKCMELFEKSLEGDGKRALKALLERCSQQNKLTDELIAKVYERLVQYKNPKLLKLLDGAIADREEDLEHIVQSVQETRVKKAILMANAVKSLHHWQQVQWAVHFEEISSAHRLFMEDPAGVYGRMSFDSRQRLLGRLESVAGIDEMAAAEGALELARAGESLQQRHVGYYLMVEEGLEKLYGKLDRVGKGKRGCLGLVLKRVLYFGMIWVPSLAVSALVAAGCWSAAGFWAIAAGFLAILPLSDLFAALAGAIMGRAVHATALLKMDYTKNLGDFTAVVTIPALIPSVDAAKKLVQQLELAYHASRDENLRYVLLGDFADEPKPVLAGDEEILEAAKAGIAALNRRWARGGDQFFLLHRPRTLSATQRRYMGRERKRGALASLNRFILGEDEVFLATEGSLERIRGAKYVITLDADTRLMKDEAKRMLAAMAYPLNWPVLNEEGTRVVQGYGLMQPRVELSIAEADRSRFAYLFGGDPGFDPYAYTASDIYQDLFGEGIFTGKGVYDVKAFTTVLEGRLPREWVLSHDLLEGSYARCALLGDVAMMDGFPKSYLAYAKRSERWIRGDWQLLPWLTGRVRDEAGGKKKNPLGPLARYKIFDNLRRSVVPVLSVGLIAMGIGLARPLLAVLAVLPMLIHPLLGLAQGLYDWAVNRGVRPGAVGKGFTRALLEIMLLGDNAVNSLFAILRALKHMAGKHKLLEWTPAAQAEHHGRGVGVYALAMAPSMALGVGFALWGIFAGAYWAVASLAFTAAPFMMAALSAKPKERPILSASDRQYIVRLARLNWAYFEEQVTEDRFFLPPDNVQLEPYRGAALRTSPTNIGLYLMACLSAYDLGFISYGEMVEKLEKTMAVVESLTKWQGHLYNWYDLTNLEVLLPKYVSTVDSGNLAGYLIIVAEGIRKGLEEPWLDGLKSDYWQAGAKDMSDLLHRNEAKLGRLEALSLAAWKSSTAAVFPAMAYDAVPAVLDAALRESLESILQPIREAASVSALQRALTAALPRLDQLRPANDGGFTVQLRSALLDSLEAAEALEKKAGRLASRMEAMVEAMNFSALYDPAMDLMRIGYDVENQLESPSHYDFLASEARQTSLVAIAKGDVPAKHWRNLGRPTERIHGKDTFLSWSGTMFEYLMPLLIFGDKPHTAMHATYAGLMAAQIAYGRERNIPWGVSESGYYAFDLALNYQYRAFGVPKVSLRMALPPDVVTAPYAAQMALMVAPEDALRDLKYFEKAGAFGRYGFYEAVDFTAERLEDQRPKVVKSFMVHHLGMALVAMDNVLMDGIHQKRTDEVLMLKAVEDLWLEKPAGVLLRKKPETIKVAQQPRRRPKPFMSRHVRQPGEDTLHFLSNGSYDLMVSAKGLGYARWQDYAIGRWRKDRVLERYGQRIVFRNLKNGETFSTAYQPALDQPDRYQVAFEPERAVFLRKDGRFTTKMESWVSPEHDVEIRRVTLENGSLIEAEFEITGFFELALSRQADDEAHMAFQNLFVTTKSVPELDALIAGRRTREGEVAPLCVGYGIYGDFEGEMTFETDRAKFYGRSYSEGYPEGIYRELERTEGAVLDPVMAIRRKLVVNKGEKKTFCCITAAAKTREETVALLKEYQNIQAVERSLELAKVHARVQAEHLKMQPKDAALFQKLASWLVLGYPKGEKSLKQRALWTYGISGDLPIVLATIDAMDQLPGAERLLKAHGYLRMKGVKVDLVFLNRYGNDYLQPLQEKLVDLVRASHARGDDAGPGGIHILKAQELSEGEGERLAATANLTVSCGENFEPLLLSEPSGYQPEFVKKRPSPWRDERVQVQEKLLFYNGTGGFTEGGREYVMNFLDGAPTPLPFANVMAGESFGTLVTESGGGYTFNINSRENKLTPWSNDAVLDPLGEMLLVRDNETGEIFSLTPRPAGRKVVVRHGQGYTVFESRPQGIQALLTEFVDTEAPVKTYRVELTNLTDSRRNLTLFFYVEWVLGVTRDAMALHGITGHEEDFLWAKNPYSDDFSGLVAYAACLEGMDDFTCHRPDFWVGDEVSGVPGGAWALTLSRRCGAATDPAAVMAVKVKLEPGESLERSFVLGEEQDLDAIHTRLAALKAEKTKSRLERVKTLWDGRLETVSVSSPDPAFDIVMNRWMLYQTLSARVLARTGFYQAGGAYGFRDQLQDGLALLYAEPERTRKLIVEFAGHQFEDGDVQHWWHPPRRGVRTKISDDLLFLAYVTLEYLEVTEDWTILEEKAPYLKGLPIPPGKEDVYANFELSGAEGDVYDHICRAVERSASRLGDHGLPLMGSGDWNDAMNRIGIEGKGESVWLGWFLLHILRRMPELARKRGIWFAPRSLSGRQVPF